MKRYLLSILAGTLLAAGSMATAWAFSPVNNGSFETGTNPGAYTTLTATDSSSIPGWTVSAGTIDYIGTYWLASNGARSLDMSGNGPGAIQQTLSTVSGHTYTVNFDMAGNPDGAPNVKTMSVGTGAATTAYSFDDTGYNKTNMGWQTMTYNFTATSASTTLTFTSTTNSPYGPALDNVVLSLNPPTQDKQCNNDGWKDYTNPSFKNKDQCNDWVEATVRGDLKMSGPSQQIKFNVGNEIPGDKDDHNGKNINTVEYWNYDYSGGPLHYEAAVTCSYVDVQNQDARFMFQIPSGHPGLSGLYIVAYVKNVKHGTDLYGHEATSSLATATQWCQTGAGFAPTMYPVTKGDIDFND